MAETIKIGGELESTATGNVVAAASAIKDKVKNKYQGEINAETDASLADRYTKAETYNKTELNNMITTPNQQYVSVTANSQTTAVTDVLPATGATDTVYRVGNWNGSQFDASVYSEYAWNGSSYVHLSTKTQVGEVFDISAYHATGGELAKYVNLAAALDSNNGGGVPQSLQKGGMSVKFVQTYDNEYVQYILREESFSTSVFDWQNVDDIENAVFGIRNSEWVQQTIVEGKYYNTNNNPINPNPGSNNGFACQKFAVKAGDKFRIYGKDINYKAYRLFVTTDSSYNQLRKADLDVNYRENPLELTIEQGEAWLFVNLNQYDSTQDKIERFIISNDKDGLVNKITVDVSKVNAVNGIPTPYRTLSDALSAIPESLKTEGMVIKYINSISNQYEQYMYKVADAATVATFTDEANWEKINTEEEVKVVSNNLYPVVGNFSNILIKQGGYVSGVPNSISERLNINRMILATELPLTITVPDENDVRLYRYHLYATANDYTSYVSFVTVKATNFKKLVLDSTLIGDNAGVTIELARTSNLSADVTPEDALGTTFKYSEGEIDKIPGIESKLENIIGTGNADYYGSPITIPITKRSQKMTLERVLTHTLSIYSHTKYNQSMAAYNGKFFCFNDTHINDGLCVVIDMDTKEVIDFVEDIPEELANSHLNNVCFTDVFYETNDAYPLILISRGDYPSAADPSVAARGKEMYVFRITETNGKFSFTHIKTIKTEHYFISPSWDYDANRKMIWGHLSEHGDWRWGNDKYRKFDNVALYFSADAGTEYVCIGTSEIAAADADITIKVSNSPEKTVSVLSGSPLSPEDTVLPYQPLPYGYLSIRANQSANAFTGQYTVYSCDENGQNRKPIDYECIICGFKAPSLTDSTTVTIPDSEIQKVKVDACIFQGGCCFAGKLFLPISAFKTVNGVPLTLSGQWCGVFDPESGAIESLIPSDNLENQGCTILDGALYISSHAANVSIETQDVFRITKFTF